MPLQGVPRRTLHHKQDCTRLLTENAKSSHTKNGRLRMALPYREKPTRDLLRVFAAGSTTPLQGSPRFQTADSTALPLQRMHTAPTPRSDIAAWLSHTENSQRFRDLLRVLPLAHQITPRARQPCCALQKQQPALHSLTENANRSHTEDRRLPRMALPYREPPTLLCSSPSFCNNAPPWHTTLHTPTTTARTALSHREHCSHTESSSSHGSPI
jgi:hypothetical protein